MSFQTYGTPEWMYQALKGIFKAILGITYDVKSFGQEKLNQIPKGQGFIIAANHGSIVDAFVMGLEVDTHRVRFVGRQRTLWGNPVFGKINDIIGTIPVPERKSKNKSLVVKVSVEAVKQGACVGIFPEGAILPWRKSFQGKTGVARIALEGHCPVVPVGLIGTDGLWPYGAKMPRLGRPVRMYVGNPIWLDDYYDMHQNFDVTRYVTDLIMREIRKESGWYGVPPEKIIELYRHYEKLSPPEV
ncbi:MAG: 1-acyl-sn-glycerol-3-phosphate acyltransferase [Methanobacteriota archaeon]|nr:MAG: 1-acyl-sn-glycerol-3-phosphate acyltransferase [Euryarchaeota archaeon]